MLNFIIIITATSCFKKREEKKNSIKSGVPVIDSPENQALHPDPYNYYSIL